MSHLPQHLKADLVDGMDSDEVLAVECNSCGRYLGQWHELEQTIEDGATWAEGGLCYECWDEG